MLRVYVAGKYNGPNVIDVLKNMRKGIALSGEVMKAGMAPFCPWLDFQLGLTDDFTVEQFRACSMEWVKCSDAMLLVEGWENSQGVADEIIVAHQFNVQIFSKLEDLIYWKNSMDRVTIGCSDS
jgi:hypothetical protein